MDLVENEYFIIPKPKHMEITQEENGITLSSLWTIYVNKYRIKDNALLLSSKFNKHFNTFLNVIPIRDSTLDEKWSEQYYIAVIAPESQYETTIKRLMDESIEKHTSKFSEIVNNCCFDLYPNRIKSKLPMEESYYINISNSAIWIISPSPRGFYHGIQTVVQIVEHKLFEAENLQNYIVLPKMVIVDFPGMKNRGISVDLNSFTPTFKALSELVPFFATNKINNIVLEHETAFPYSEEEEKSFRDVCKFHHIDFKFVTKFAELNENSIKLFHYSTEGRFILPNYQLSIEKLIESVVKLNDVEGIIVATPLNWNCPAELFIPYIPVIADILWNPKPPLTTKRWMHFSGGTHLNLFEDSLQKSTFDFQKLVYCSSDDVRENYDALNELSRGFADLRKYAYENIHLIDILEWGFQTRELFLSIEKMKNDLKHLSSEKIENLDFSSSLQEYSTTYNDLINVAVKLLETTNRVQKGACKRYFQHHNSQLKTLVESWIPEFLEK